MVLSGVTQKPSYVDQSLVGGLRADHLKTHLPVPKTMLARPFKKGSNETWLTIDATYPHQVAERLRIIREKQADVIDRLDGEDVAPAEIELRDKVVSYLLETYPDYFDMDKGVMTSKLSGISVDLREGITDPLIAMAVLAAEDQLIMVPDGETESGCTRFVLKSGALVFPNGWSLRSKFNENMPDPHDIRAYSQWDARKKKSVQQARLGKDVVGAHNPQVAEFMKRFACPAEQFFNRMPTDKFFWRRNWGMETNETLMLHFDNPDPHPQHERNAANWEQYGRIRSEHETFVKLSESQAVIFTIKTYIWHVKEFMNTPGAMEALIAANDGLTEDLVAYRADGDRIGSFRRDWLDTKRAQFPVTSKNSGNDNPPKPKPDGGNIGKCPFGHG